LRLSRWGIILGAILWGLGGCATDKEIKKGDQSQVHFQLGVSYLNEGDATRALGELLKAREFAPDDAEILNALGLAYFSKGSREEAIASFQKAIKCKADFSEACNNMGVVYLDQGEWDKAITCFEKALKNLLYQTPERARVNLGWAFFKKKDYSQAIGEFKQALVESPRFCLAHNYLGQAYMETSKYEDAIFEFRLTNKYCPQYVEVFLNLGLAYIKTGRAQEACINFNRAQQLGGEGEIARTAARYLKLLKCSPSDK
jgi:type IV pilus biogenesis/stability protein PilW